MTDVAPLSVRPDASIREAIERIDAAGLGIVLVADEEGVLLGTVTDGDVRRAVLAEVDPESPVTALLDRVRRPNPEPVTAPVGTGPLELLELMNVSGLRHIPLLDERGRVVDVALLSELVREPGVQLRAVVMAGGRGSRLGKLTETVPKPMLKVGDRPLLERIVEQLRSAGIQNVKLMTHYGHSSIEEHFGDGARFGVDIEYVTEESPLGTAGGLALLEASRDPVLVMNGDILTSVDFRAMLTFHQEHDADMTVAVRRYEVTVPYGLVETDGERIRAVLEKPLVSGFVNAGIYLMDGDVVRLVPPGRQYEMPELIERLLADGRTVVGFPLREYWLDIGRVEDYERALADFPGEP